MTVSPSTLRREAGTSPKTARKTRRRLSTSHLLIGAVAVLAVVFNLLALQDRSATALVAVADHPITAGSVFDPGDVRLVPVAADFEGLGTLLTEAELAGYQGWVVERPVPEGGLIDVSILAEPGAPSGLRSMSLPVPVERAAGGSIVAGDRVDVISVVDGTARYVAAGIEVIGVADTDRSALAGMGSYHIVVAVDSEQALRLAEALGASSIEVVRSTGAPPVEEGVGADGP